MKLGKKGVLRAAAASVVGAAGLTAGGCTGFPIVSLPPFILDDNGARVMNDHDIRQRDQQIAADQDLMPFRR